ncbi:MAG: excinuclease ABC subunit UvrA [Candidatus Cloacimonetes bacterium]|jgi:excinuclease ABC subunit A|nr:excinuclease ABC subunit UvrA [Candidatus Cloacimonadota bacterium]MBT5420476.1 excinuclease ABC subunit UvrA [Candidatus Cloacimonadota bacterium]
MKTDIYIKGAREHNLKNIDIRIPRNKLVIVTGVSGSGKSSLAFDTLYAEGQRRYVESLSAYARQFLGQMEKPKVDYIEGLSPAISIEQKATSKNPRSTVGTVTEIYDYLRILYARIGKQFCYKCGEAVGSQTVDQLVDHILENPVKTRLQILAPIVQNRKGEHKDELEEARNEGFVRVKINGIMRQLSEEINLDKKSKHNIDIIVDRIVLKDNIRSRLIDSVETALKLTNGFIKIEYIDEGRTENLSEANSCPTCGIGYPELSPQHFSFNSPIGMCKSCNGLGTKMEFDPDLLIPDKSLSVMEGAVVHWGTLNKKKSSWQLKKLRAISREYGFSLDDPWEELSVTVKDLLLFGSRGQKIKFEWSSKSGSGSFLSSFEGIIPTLSRRMSETKSEYMRKYYIKYIGNKVCPDCNGRKLRKESLAVKIADLSINEISSMSISNAIEFFNNLKLTGNDKLIAEEVLKEINNRLSFLVNVGLHYLTLDRKAPTLSGGESQRIRLASQIGSSLVGVMYILDEPTIGLHQRDNQRLINMLVHLRDIGNTVIVVEHDEQMIRTADQIIDIGPHAGIYGGEIVFQGNIEKLLRSRKSMTGKYLSGKLSIEMPKERMKPDKRKLQVFGASQNNLQNINVEIPVGSFTCVTGVSGSGKSSLINQILYPAMAKELNKSSKKLGLFKKILGYEYFDKVININQQPIGRTPRSNPATYTKLFDPIRNLFSQTPAAKLRGYKPGRFSFNVKGGRCEACGGGGVKQIEMHFLPDIYVKCEVCNGTRYNKETLAVKFKGHSIADVLEMDVQEAMELFKKVPKIYKVLQTLNEVGLEYVKLGQASTTLSGGEAQRIKLSRELSKTSTGKTLYILDEPTTGLHFEDIKKLLKVLHRLVSMGNTVIVIEHNLDVIKCADHIIDLGPEGGDEGGKVVATGTPEEIVKIRKSFTGRFLKEIL